MKFGIYAVKVIDGLSYRTPTMLFEANTPEERVKSIEFANRTATEKYFAEVHDEPLIPFREVVAQAFEKP